MAGTADATDDVHRLRDIVVEEVSLVDRAANKRRFLVVKRSDEMGIEADETEDGEATEGEVEKAKRKPPANAEEIDEAKRKIPDDEDEMEDAEKAARSSDDEEEDEKEEKASASKDDPDDEEGTDKDAPEKKKRRKPLLALSKAAKGALLGGITDGLERLMVLAKEVKDAPELETSSGVPAKLSSDISAVVGQLAGLVDAEPSKARKSVTKGARMAKERLDRFQKALSLLADILKELTEVKEGLPTPTAGSAEAGVAKAESVAAPAVAPGLTDLVKGIGDLTQVVKRQGEELGRIRQTHGVSNAIQVDSGRRTAPIDVSWPLDMNRPISREQVKKEVSFFDE